MPIVDRDYFRGEHPPACTCADCVLSRLETGYFLCGSRPMSRSWLYYSYANGVHFLVQVSGGQLPEEEHT